MKPHFEIEDVFTVTGRGTTITGKHTGVYNVGDKIIYEGQTALIRGIECFRVPHWRSLSIGLLVDLPKETFSKGQIWYLEPKEIDWDKYTTEHIELEDVDTYVLLIELWAPPKDTYVHFALRHYTKYELMAELASRIDNKIG